MNMSDLIKLTPVFHEKIWGGRQLETVFGYDIPEGPIGECWAISAHPNGDCQIAEGPYAGHTLSWLWAEHRELFGNCEGKEFPLLIKILDAKDDLSIQIHPNDEYAAEHENGSLGKTECWYVLDCEPGSTIIVGQRAHDRAEAAQMIEEGRWDEMLNVLPIHKGDFFQIDSGTVHAIKTGTLILETQQSSDVTYRLYDYDRPGTDGKLRPLHIEQSLDCIDFAVQAPTDGTVTAPEVDGVTELESNPCYTVDRVRVDGSKTLEQRWPFMCLSVIDGKGTVCGDPVHKGSHLLAQFINYIHLCHLQAQLIRLQLVEVEHLVDESQHSVHTHAHMVQRAMHRLRQSLVGIQRHQRTGDDGNRVSELMGNIGKESHVHLLGEFLPLTLLLFLQEMKPVGSCPEIERVEDMKHQGNDAEIEQPCRS